MLSKIVVKGTKNEAMNILGARYALKTRESNDILCKVSRRVKKYNQ